MFVGKDEVSQRGDDGWSDTGRDGGGYKHKNRGGLAAHTVRHHQLKSRGDVQQEGHQYHVHNGVQAHEPVGVLHAERDDRQRGGRCQQPCVEAHVSIGDAALVQPVDDHAFAQDARGTDDVDYAHDRGVLLG
ncbi:hypothetical protein D3C84_812800 [compost metagenome]